MSDKAPKALSGIGADTFPMLRRLFAEHGRRHLPSYLSAMALLGVGAAIVMTRRAAAR